MADFDFETDAAEEELSDVEELVSTLRSDLQTLQRRQRDIEQKILQSEGQVEQLTQRNAVIMGELQKVRSQIEQVPRVTVQETYDEALSTQQRLMMIRAETDKLQAQEDATRTQIGLLENIIQALSANGDVEDESESFNAKEIIVKIIDAQEEERDRLARKMHDGPAHSLTNFILQAEICQKLFDKDVERARVELVRLKASANSSFQEVRGFIEELRPMMLGDLGLAPTLKRYITQYGEKNEITTDFESAGQIPRLEAYREVLLFRGVQAILSSARNLGEASQIEVKLELSGDRVRAVVDSNGRTVDTEQLQLDAKTKDALGLGTLQERVTLVGGDLHVEATPNGARIEISIPKGPPPGTEEVEFDEFA